MDLYNDYVFDKYFLMLNKKINSLKTMEIFHDNINLKNKLQFLTKSLMNLNIIVYLMIIL
jgi:hypothetical protein